jgi:glycosyltransferase involved in cell wall biosynthesis/GT2 family glycosyltransferase
MNKMKVSVVINTYNRAESLKSTLKSLEYQKFHDFEVIIVNGPSTDNTEEVIHKYDGVIKYLRCPERNLSISRNIGICASSGDIVAFIDDDAIATSQWLADLVKGYDSESVGGVGGLVYDHSGMTLQARYVACSRLGGKAEDIVPPFDVFNKPGAEPFMHLLGTNASFRRSVLCAIGGFDEEYEYFLDETDLCMRVIDAGYVLRPLDRAIIHHKFLPSHLRNKERVLLEPYPIVKNIVYFTIKNHIERNLQVDEKKLNEYLERVYNGADYCFRHNLMTLGQYEYFLTRVNIGKENGIKKSVQKRRIKNIAPRDEDTFLRFKTLSPSKGQLNICFVSSEYPPNGYGGSGRYTHDLASGFADVGHEVHVITVSNLDTSYVKYENGVWVHYVTMTLINVCQNHPIYHRFVLWANIWNEAKRIHRESPISLMNGPLWTADSFLAAIVGEFPVILTYITSHKIMDKINPKFAPEKPKRMLLIAERIAIQVHGYGHAISSSILRHIDEEFGLPPYAFVTPLCIEDKSKDISKTAGFTDEKIKVLSVARIEPRKGIDILLSAAKKILFQRKDVEFYFVGRDPCLPGFDVIQKFQIENAGNFDLLNSVHFLGEVSEEKLHQYYRESDIFCLPSRYESFGLVLVEAMTFGLPCVASNAGGISEIVIDGITGFLFENENVDDLVHKLLKLCDAKELRTEMGKVGRRRFEMEFSPKVVVEKLEENYRAVISDFEQYRQRKVRTHKDIEKYMLDLFRYNFSIKKFRAVLLVKAMLDLRLIFPDLHADWGKMHKITYFFKENISSPVFSWFRAKIKSILRACKDQESMPRRIRYMYELVKELRDTTHELKDITRESRDKISGCFNLIETKTNGILSEMAVSMHEKSNTEEQVWEIINEEKWHSQLSKNEIRLNVGCGHIVYSEYINVDCRKLDEVDIVGNASCLNISRATVSEIYSAHLFEHFPRETLRRKIIPHWRELLNDKGFLRIIVPDMEAMIEAFVAGRMSFDDLRTVLFGLQDYSRNFHYTCFGRKDIVKIMECCDLKGIEWIAQARRNGLCFEMELKAYKN